MTNIFNNESLRLSRAYLGYTQKQFSEEMEISQSLLSKIEKDIKPLTGEIVDKLKLRFGELFFRQKESFPDLKVFYRTSNTISKKIKNMFEARLQIISNNIDEITEYIELPENKIPKIDLEDFGGDVKFLAREIRQSFKLGMKPINNLVGLLESLGCLIHFYEYDFVSSQAKNLDGVSFFVAGVPVILINNKIQGARKQFTLAHELGHLILHNHSDFIISKDRDVEKEANMFASEFLVPDDCVSEQLRYANIEDLFELKHYWKLSAAALLYKGGKTSMRYDRHRRLITRMAPYRKVEPNDFTVSKPTVLKESFELLLNEYSEDFYDKLYLSEKLFNEVYTNILENNSSFHRMKVIR